MKTFVDKFSFFSPAAEKNTQKTKPALTLQLSCRCISVAAKLFHVNDDKNVKGLGQLFQFCLSVEKCKMPFTSWFDFIWNRSSLSRSSVLLHILCAVTDSLVLWFECIPGHLTLLPCPQFNSCFLPIPSTLKETWIASLS